MKVKLNGNDFYEVSSNFASIDSVHKVAHSGIDLVMNTGTKLYSPVNGIIRKVVDYGDKNVGKGIFIETEDHQTVILGHLSDFKVTEGQSVHEGDLVGLSGNTGHSTGSHLHLGLKDVDGSIINPEPLLNVDRGTGFVNEVKDSWDFIHKWQDVGFWRAMYDKSFFEVLKDFFAELAHDIGVFILGNGDLLFLLPAIVFMFGTFIIGRNRFTKWIIPLWFAYFASTVFYKILL